MDGFQILVFGSKDDRDEGWARCQSLAKTLQAEGMTVRLVNKLCFNLDDLHLVARYKIVSTPSIIILRQPEERVVFRKLGLTSALALREAMESLSTKQTV